MSTTSPKRKKYGLLFPDDAPDLLIEFHMIQKGREWLESKGSGLFFHYKEAQKLLWPKEDHHRWSDLILKEILQNDITALLGAKDSGKTHGMCKFGLTDYFCFPEETLIVVSSTDMRSLEGRVWGDIKAMFIKAHELHPWLAGHVLDSKHAICTDDLDDESVIARDMRKGILCFPAGSEVDTPTGPKLIESIRAGDEVLNAFGIGIVKESFSRIAPTLVRITLSDGRQIDCTPEHPVFTQRGWINAIALETCDMVFSPDEALQIVQGATGSGIPESKVLLSDLPTVPSGEELRSMSKTIPTLESKNGQSHWKILWNGLRRALGFRKHAMRETKHPEMPPLQASNEECPPQPKVLLNYVSRQNGNDALRELRAKVRRDFIDKESKESFLQHVLSMERNEAEAESHRPKTDPGRIGRLENVPASDVELSLFHRIKKEERSASLVQNGCGISGYKTGCGNRRENSRNEAMSGERQTPNANPEFAWVDSVEVLESGSDSRFKSDQGGYSVHNLEIAGHPSYFVNGILVHNCIPCKNASGGQTNISAYVGMKQKRRRYLADEFQFMSLSMYDSLGNANAGDFKLVAAGNPIGQGDPLDLISEPECGWLAMPEPDKTTTWNNRRFLRSRTVNLVGTDSPNFDFDQSLPPRYPYLTNRDSIARTVAGYGIDSHQYYSQCKGVRRSGLNARRVITRELCETHKAFEQITWEGAPLTKIFALDAAYGGIGGDRCIGGHIEFGRCIDGKDRIFVRPFQQVPVSVKKAQSPEDQIAEWVKTYCDAQGIPYENGFYDSTGRGSLGLAFARLGMVKFNPVEFGGAASERPVSMDLYVYDEKTRERRLKKCSEHYRKFVTELWWSVRIVIESDQLRGMSDEIVEDGCMREWKEVAGAKIEVEPKEDTKERMGKSPDIFDWLVTAVEGARQKGFLITRLSNESATAAQADWIEQQDREYQEFLRGRMLSNV